jgi:zinc protease
VFGEVPGGGAPPRPSQASQEPPQTQARSGLADRGGQVGIVAVAWKVPAETEVADLAALKLAMASLASGETARLGARLVRKDAIAVAAGGQLLITAEPGLFIVYAAYRETELGPKVAAALIAEVNRLARAPLPAAELGQARTQLLTFTAAGLERAGDLAFQAASSWARTGKPLAFLDSADAIARVKPADVQRVARTHLTEAQATTLTVPIVEAGGGR